MPEDKKNKSKKIAAKSLSGTNTITADFFNNPSRTQTSISADTRSQDEKEVGQAMYFKRKKQEESQGADFTTPEFIKQQREKIKERIGRAATVGLTGAALLTGPGLIRSSLGRGGASVMESIKGIELAPNTTVIDKIIGLAQVISPDIPAVQDIAAKFLLKSIPEQLQTDKFKEIVGRYVIGDKIKKQVANEGASNKTSYSQYRKLGTGK